MSVAVPGAVTTAIFLLITWAIFVDYLGVTTDQTEALREANLVHRETFGTLISITSTNSADCTYRATIRNDSNSISFGDFSTLDVIIHYDAATGYKTSKWLSYQSQWLLTSITGDGANPNVWDPKDILNISFTVQPALQDGAKGTLVMAVPGGVYDSAYFDKSPCRSYYWHNDPTPPDDHTASHQVLTMDGAAPNVTTLYNYDTNRDLSEGLLIAKGGSGANETDFTKHQVWRTGPLALGLAITGDVTIDFWSGLKDFKLSAVGRATIYLRDYDGVGAYTEIGDGQVFDADWQGGSGTFVKKTITIPDLSYTLPANHELEAKLIVNSGSADDMWFAYDTTSHASVIKLP